jgi:hypothetical protein
LGANAPQILRRIPEFSVRELDPGLRSVGTFGYEEKDLRYAQAIGREVAARIAAWGPDCCFRVAKVAGCN